MKGVFTVYTIDAMSRILELKPGTIKQRLRRFKEAGKPLVIGDYKFILIGSNGYIAVHKDEVINIVQ